MTEAIRTRVELVGADHDPEAILHFTNETDSPVWLAIDRCFMRGSADGDYLEFEPSAAYLGIAKKRLPYRADELVKVAAGEEVQSQAVRLRDVYELQDGLVDRRVRYRATHPLAGVGTAMRWVESPWATT